MSLRIAAARLTELHTVKRMIGGSGGENPSSDSQTLNVCEGGRGRKPSATPRYVEAAFSLRLEEGSRTERAPGESVVPLVGLTR